MAKRKPPADINHPQFLAPPSPTFLRRERLSREGKENWKARRRMLSNARRMRIYTESVNILLESGTGLRPVQLRELKRFMWGAEALLNNPRTKKKSHYEKLHAKLTALEERARKISPNKF